MLTTDRQYQRLMKEYNSNGVLKLTELEPVPTSQLVGDEPVRK